MKISKKVAVPLIVMLSIGLAFATGFVVNSFVIKADVMEPFSVKYYIIGDAGNYDGSTLCSSIDENEYQTMPDGEEVDVDGLYVGESRKFCVLINNAGGGDIPYTIESKVKTGLGNYNDCVIAFPETTKTGTVNGESSKLDGHVINVPANAPPVEDCEIIISVARG